MKLSIEERLVISGLYPKKGNIISQTIVRDIEKKVRIGQEEIKEIDLELHPSSNGKVSYTWNKEKVKELEVDFTEAELELLKKQVKDLDKKEEITQQLLSICRKIQEA